MAISPANPARRGARGMVRNAPSHRWKPGGGLDRLQIKMASHIFGGRVAARLVVPGLQEANGVRGCDQASSALTGKNLTCNAIEVPTFVNFSQEPVNGRVPGRIGGEVDELVRIVSKVVELVRVARSVDKFQWAATNHDHGRHSSFAHVFGVDR